MDITSPNFTVVIDPRQRDLILRALKVVLDNPSFVTGCDLTPDEISEASLLVAMLPTLVAGDTVNGLCY